MGLVRRLRRRLIARHPPGFDKHVLAVGRSFEAAPAESSTWAALARTIAKLLSDAVQLLLADVAGLEAPSQLLSLALPKLAHLVRLPWSGLEGRRNCQRLHIGLSLAYSQTSYEDHAQADAPYHGNDQQYDK